MRTPLVVFSAALAALASAPLRAQEKAAPAPKPLYERLGGVYSIAAVVDDFIERLYVNNTLNANPAVAGARNQARKPGLKVQVTMSGTLPLALAASLVGSAAAAADRPQPMLGEPAPSFRLPDLSGQTRSLEEWRGRLIVLHFGASW
jgi:hypothetical protein